MLTNQQLDETRRVLAAANLCLAKLSVHEPDIGMLGIQQCQTCLVNMMNRLAEYLSAREREQRSLGPGTIEGG